MLLVIISAALAGLLSVASAQNDIIVCAEPPDVKSAFVSNVTDVDYKLGTMVTYECDGGYSSSGESRTIFCDEDDSGNGVWSKTRFFCAPKSCGDPGYVNNGRRVGHRFTFPNSVKFECDDGYKIKGIPTRYCQTSGLWSGRLPSCHIVTCEPPEEIANGHVTYNSLEYGAELIYECNKGFKLQMNGTVYCTADGQWSKNSVECVESSCEFPVAPEHGSVRFADNDEVPRSGTIAVYECHGDTVAYGATTFKCLDDGQWLFPAPECLPPCTVPNIREGELGSYQKKYYSQGLSFNEKSAGTRIKDDEELALRCSHGYEVESTENREMKISCKRGKWSLKPLCEPASCRINPPSVQNAEIVDVNPKHGGKVIYRCKKNFKKIKDDNVVCNFGSWKPSYPYNLCQSSQCSKHTLNFDGLRKGYQEMYDDGHIFQISCGTGYRINDEAELRCSEGDWRTNVPPCVPADCTEPPVVTFTKVEKASTSHGSYATYACQEPYKMIGDPQVQCWRGEWKKTPRCDDGRCDLNDLLHSSHISREETPRYTNSGQDLQLTCKEGYSPRLLTPYCLNGAWERNTRSPCKENDCLVPEIEQGHILLKVLGKKYWHYWHRRYLQDVIKVEKVPYGTLASPSTEYHLLCADGYSFQGAPETERRITCTKGNWSPTPVCIRRGTKWTPTQPAISTKWSNNAATSTMQETTPMSVTTESRKTSVSDVIQPEVVTTESPTTAEPVKCSCQYPLDDKSLIATADGRQLHYLDKVDDGSVVVFRCLYVGYHRFNGPREMKCENCQNWDSSDFPICSSPSRGDTIIIFQSDMNISVDGSLEVQKGRNLDLSCIVYEGGVYPNWTAPTLNGITFSWEQKNRKDRQDILYISLLKIENAALENEGAYNCSTEDRANTSSTVTVTVIDPNVRCPKFQDDDDEIHISYNNERRVKSKATFSCKYQARDLKGKATTVCLTNGNWSDPPPQCLKRQCKMLNETEQLKITYDNDQEIGSRAGFDCVDGTKRVGVAFAECLDNGSWSHPTPACNYPPCSLEAIYPLLPKEAVPEVLNGQSNIFEYNTKMSLRCEVITLGDSSATCGKNSTWEIPPSFLCSPGCPAQDKLPNSKLIMDPTKDIYNFGETVRFSCPHGMKLTTKVQTDVCMRNGWSEKNVPDCA